MTEVGILTPDHLQIIPLSKGVGVVIYCKNSEEAEKVKKGLITSLTAVGEIKTRVEAVNGVLKQAEESPEIWDTKEILLEFKKNIQTLVS